MKRGRKGERERGKESQIMCGVLEFQGVYMQVPMSQRELGQYFIWDEHRISPVPGSLVDWATV